MKSRENKIGNQIYYGHKNDRTDQLLGDFLCKFNEIKPLKIMFLRETEGVYQFG